MKQISTAPFIHSGRRSSDFPLWQLYCLIPALAWGVYRYGWYALVIIGLSLLTAILTELVFSKGLLKRKPDIPSVLLVGVLIAMCMPPQVPWYMVIGAALAGVLLGSVLLGGTSAAWINPAGFGLLFAVLCWPGFFSQSHGSYLGSWFDLVTKHGGPSMGPGDMAPIFAVSARPDLTGKIAMGIANVTGLNVPENIIASFLGFGNGPLGLSSPVLLLAGSVLPFARRLGDWRPSLSAFSVFAVFAWLFGGFAWGRGIGNGDVLFHLFNGPFLIVVLFMIQDYGSLPVTRSGRWVYGALTGFVLWVVSQFGTIEMGMVLGLVFVNVFSPLIDSGLRRRQRVVAQREAS